MIYGNDAHQSGDLEFKVFGEHAVAGSKDAEVIPQLAPADGDLVVPKRFYSSFTSTDLDATCQVQQDRPPGARQAAHRLLLPAHDL